MKFRNIEYGNFGPFASIAMAMSDLGLVLVQGENRMSTSADSNGSGKSYLLEGLVWSLFGRTIRGQTGDEVVNRAAGKNCYVRTRIDSAGREIEVIRYRKAKAGAFTVPGGDPGPSGTGLLVYVDGNDMTRGTTKETDKLVTELLGLDFDSFVRAVYFDGHSIAPFPTLTDKEIKAIFERVLSLEDLTKAGDVVKKRKLTISGNLARLDGEIAMARSQASTADLERLTALDRAGEFGVECVREISHLNCKIADLEAEYVDPSVLDAEDAEITAEQADITAKMGAFAALDGMIAKYNADTSAMTLSRGSKLAEREAKLRELANIQPPAALTTRIAEIAARGSQLTSEQARLPSASPPADLSRELAQASHALSEAMAKMTEHDGVRSNASAKIGSACGECGKTYVEGDLSAIIDHANRHYEAASRSHDTSLDDVRDVQARIDDWRREQADRIADAILLQRSDLEAANKEVAEYRVAAEAAIRDHIAAIDTTIAGLDEQAASLVAMKEKLDALAGMRLELQKKLVEFPSRFSAVAIRREANGRLLASRSEIEATIASIKARTNPYESDVERWSERKKEAEAAMLAREMESADDRKAMVNLEVLERAYGRTGLKAHILETVTPVLNARANDYATRLADGAVKIAFDTVTKNKDGTVSEKFSVTVTNDQGADGYLGNSSGERKKIDLSIALAMSDLVAARASNPIDLFVADEIAESLDPTALERVAGLLQDKAKERGTLLAISHTDLTTFIPNVLTVKKMPGGSTLYAGRTW